MLFDDPRYAANKIIELVGPKIVLVTPLGLGKPVQLLNELYERVKNDNSLELCILTALTLSKPKVDGELAQKLFNPFFDRVYGDYEDLSFEVDRRAQALPTNVRVIEFFLAAGQYLENPKAQQDFIYTNYTHVIRDILPHGVNVIAFMTAEGTSPERLSLSCNADLTMDLIKACPAAHLAAQINSHLPFMSGEQVELVAEKCSIILKHDQLNKKLFSIPKMPLNIQDYAVGLYSSSLIEDDGCLQIGIGKLSDALAYGLILRHKNSASYTKIQKKLRVIKPNVEPFSVGLSALTEMLVDGYLELYDAGILQRNIGDQNYVAHAGFFIGSNDFYERLRQMPNAKRKRFSMRSVNEINQLYGDEEKRRLERRNACFVNVCMKATILGETISDSLSDGTTVSGVGGQYNFVAMAQELESAKSIILCKSYREKNGKPVSNIVFNDGPVTVSRHLRDILVTEYGIAYLRGKTDEEVIKAILNITDSRFQQKLLRQAKAAKKISVDYQIPEIHRHNLPQKLNAIFNDNDFQGLFLPFPFGSEFEKEEIQLLQILQRIKKASVTTKLMMLIKGWLKSPSPSEKVLLRRMGLTKVRSLKLIIYRLLLLGGMQN